VFHPSRVGTTRPGEELTVAERRFACTACGRCCRGWLPLTLDDALAHAHRFPLAVACTPVLQGHKAFALTARLGTTIRLPNKREAAVRLTPIAYLPPGFACPELAANGRCAIHGDKPLRCRTMPFFPYAEESDQAGMLVPRQGWECDTSAVAPVVYRNRRIVDATDFERERAALLASAPALRAWAEALMKTVPALADGLAKVAMRPGGEVVVGFALLLKRQCGAAEVARSQLPVLQAYAQRTAGDPALAEHNRRYQDWAAEMERLARRPT
jgi:Fe-S-cluster containining protein